MQAIITIDMDESQYNNYQAITDEFINALDAVGINNTTVQEYN